MYMAQYAYQSALVRGLRAPYSSSRCTSTLPGFAMGEQCLAWILLCALQLVTWGDQGPASGTRLASSHLPKDTALVVCVLPLARAWLSSARPARLRIKLFYLRTHMWMEKENREAVSNSVFVEEGDQVVRT